MVWFVLTLIPLAALVALLGTWGARALGRRLRALDGAGVAGQVKVAPRRVPNTGGVGIFLGFALPLTAIVLLFATVDVGAWLRESTSASEWMARLFNVPASLVASHADSLREHSRGAWSLLLGVLALHVLGLVDDRNPLPALPKLFVMIAVSLGVLMLTQTRMFTFVDAVAGGAWASLALTLLWILIVTNAMNFLDNMDGLSAGVGAIASASFMTIALLQGQWFIAGCFALLVGSLLGFLWFNKPIASIFMGDGGSLVLGFLLAFLSVRITYASTILEGMPMKELPRMGQLRTPESATSWHAVLSPLVVLAIPLYDLASVVLLRLRQGKNPMIGDLQHISHRFVRRGLSRTIAVAVICGFAGVAAIAGVLLTRTDATGAVMIGAQVALLLLILAAIEFAGVLPIASEDRR